MFNTSLYVLSDRVYQLEEVLDGEGIGEPRGTIEEQAQG